LAKDYVARLMKAFGGASALQREFDRAAASQTDDFIFDTLRAALESAGIRVPVKWTEPR
jgi:hypothetical protein